MTAEIDEDGVEIAEDDIVERLQEPLTAGMFLNMSALIAVMDAQRKEAAAEIERLRARVAELEAALRQISEDAYVTVHTKKNGGVSWRKMYQGWKRIACDRIDIARAALIDKEHNDG